MTDEGKGPTEKWVKEKQAKYAYAYDAGGKFARTCGVSGIPHSVLVDPTGKVVYAGGPSGINDEAVKAATSGALKKPLWELPKALAKVRTGVAKGDLSVALKEAEAVAAKPEAPPEAAEVVASLKGMISSSLAAGQGLEESGDWLGAQRSYERLAKSAKGLPEEATAREKLAAIAKNDEAQKAIKTQKALEKILATEVKNKKDAEELQAALENFIKKNQGTFAAKRAEARIASTKGG